MAASVLGDKKEFLQLGDAVFVETIKRIAEVAKLVQLGTSSQTHTLFDDLFDGVNNHASVFEVAPQLSYCIWTAFKSIDRVKSCQVTGGCLSDLFEAADAASSTLRQRFILKRPREQALQRSATCQLR